MKSERIEYTDRGKKMATGNMLNDIGNRKYSSRVEILPIHKNGDQTDCGNYRAICLLTVIFKMYIGII